MPFAMITARIGGDDEDRWGLRRAGGERGPAMRFEVEVYRDETGEWVATAIEYDITRKGRTEKESLAFLMDALTTHIAKGGGKKPL